MEKTTKAPNPTKYVTPDFTRDWLRDFIFFLLGFTFAAFTINTFFSQFQKQPTPQIQKPNEQSSPYSVSRWCKIGESAGKNCRDGSDSGA